MIIKRNNENNIIKLDNFCKYHFELTRSTIMRSNIISKTNTIIIIIGDNKQILLTHKSRVVKKKQKK